MAAVSKSNWMKTCPGMAKLSLAEFCFPGTHDSGAFQQPNFSIVADDSTLARSPMRFAPGYQEIATRWSVSQPGANIYSQLMNGARFLDFRVAYAPVSEGATQSQFYLTHTFIMCTLDVALSQVRKFLSENPSEVIILTLALKYRVDAADLQAFVKQYLGDLLYQGENGRLNLSVTPDTIRKQGKQVIATVETNQLQPGFFSRGSLIFTPAFHSVDQVNAKQAYDQQTLQAFINSGRRRQVLFQMEYTLTEVSIDVVKSLFTGGSLQELADKLNPTQKIFILDTLTPLQRSTINIITNDDLMHSDNVSVVIKLIAERTATKVPVQRPLAAPQGVMSNVSLHTAPNKQCSAEAACGGMEQDESAWRPAVPVRKRMTLSRKVWRGICRCCCCVCCVQEPEDDREAGEKLMN